MGLKRLQEERRIRYHRHAPQRTALDDMMSLERIEQEKREKDLENFPSTSTKSEEDDMALSTDEAPHDTATITERVPYDIAHPPSPKVSKGTNIKKSANIPKVDKSPISSTASSSDVDIRQSGVVAADVDKSSDDSTTEGLNTTNISRGMLKLSYPMYAYCSITVICE